MATSKALKKPAETASTSVAVKPKVNTNMVSIREQLAIQAAAMADRISPPSGSKIKLSPRAMTLPDGTKTPGPLEAVVVDFVAKNAYYPGAYDKDNILPPVCFAIGEIPAKLAPSPNSPEPQAKTCGECPMNAFGSAPNGKGKACKNERLMAVLPPRSEKDTDEDVLNAPLWTISAGPTSIKGFDSYVGNVQRVFQMPPVGVVTTISMADSDYAGTLYGDPQPNPDLELHFSRQAEAKALLAAEPDLTGYEPASAKPARKAAPARPAARR